MMDDGDSDDGGRDDGGRPGGRDGVAHVAAILAAANPAAPRDLGDLVRGEEARALVSRVVAQPVPGRFTRPPRRRTATAVGVIALATSIGVATASLRGGDSGHFDTVTCFTGPDLDADAAVAVVGTAGPVATCRMLWGFGNLSESAIPALSACTLESGGPGVFPTGDGDTCAELGLLAADDAVSSRSDAGTEALPGDPGGDPSGVDAFTDAVVHRVLDAGCLDLAEVAAIVREELDRAELSGWAITEGEGGPATALSPEGPCASMSVVPERQVVVLLPSPNSGSGGGPASLPTS